MSLIKNSLLGLSIAEKLEREKVAVDYYFYKGVCEDRAIAEKYKPYLGQSWEDNKEIDYIPAQDIRNKVKPLLKKQARWMFSNKPDLLFNPINNADKDECELLRQWVDALLEKNMFWKKSKQAFLMSTIKKRTMLRIAAGKGKINMRYEDIENFSYKEIDGQLMEARFFQEDISNAYYENEEDKKIYYIHKFYYKKIIEDEPVKAMYCKETYANGDTKTPVKVEEQELGFNLNKIPCWLIINGGELGEEFGETDLHDLKVIQESYNRKVSDVSDAIKFGLFGAEAVIDGDEINVNKFSITPGALHAVHTDSSAAADGKQASVQRLEYSLSGIEAAETYLERAEADMNYILDMPSLKDLNNIPSAKAMRYLYNDLIARCEEKWNDWGSIITDVIRYIISIASEAKLEDFNPKWEALEFTIKLNHNYPIPSDEEERKTLAMNEVINKVRTIKSYIKEFSNEEDIDATYMEILKEASEFAGVEMSEFATVTNQSTKEDTADNESDEEENEDVEDDE